MTSWEVVAMQAVGRYHRNMGAYSKSEAFARTVAGTTLSLSEVARAGKRYHQLLNVATRARQAVIDKY